MNAVIEDYTSTVKRIVRQDDEMVEVVIDAPRDLRWSEAKKRSTVSVTIHRTNSDDGKNRMSPFERALREYVRIRDAHFAAVREDRKYRDGLNLLPFPPHMLDWASDQMYDLRTGRIPVSAQGLLQKLAPEIVAYAQTAR